MRDLKYGVAGILLLVSGISQAIVINGLDWRQLNESTNLSYNQVSSVCSVITGVCNGSVGTTDFTGWNWASANDVASLFNFFNPAFNSAFTGLDGVTIQEVNEFDSAWAPEFFTVFDSVAPFVSSIAQGLTRTATIDQPFNAFIFDTDNPLFEDTMLISAAGDFTRTSGISGHWLYRGDNVSVPEPSTYLLVGLGLIGLSYARRRKTL